jgi:hypothetical protein
MRYVIYLNTTPGVLVLIQLLYFFAKQDTQLH